MILISRESLEELYNKEDLKKAYKSGKIGKEILNYLPDRGKIIKEELSSKKITLEDVISLYSKDDGISYIYCDGEGENHIKNCNKCHFDENFLHEAKTLFISTAVLTR